MDEAEHCHRLAFIQDGEIIAYGAPDEIKSSMVKVQVLEISPSEPIKTISLLEEAKRTGKLLIDEVELYGSLVHVFSQDMKKREKEIKSFLRTQNIEITHSAIIEPSLEDVFIACMKDGMKRKNQNVTLVE
jgi:ABC-type multidrug transport system ATPase subunit